MIAAVLLLFTLSSSRLVGRDVCLDSSEARLVVSRLEDRLTVSAASGIPTTPQPSSPRTQPMSRPSRHSTCAC